MSTLTTAEQERLYDAQRSGAAYFGPTPPSIEAQIAAIAPADIHDSQAILSMTLPSGEQVTRPTFDGRPADWVSVKRGAVDFDIMADGTVGGISFAGHYLDENFTLADLDDLRALLSLDRAQLSQIAELGPATRDDIKAWYALGNAEMRRISETIGFSGWVKARRRQ